LFQVPPRAFETRQIVTGAPLATSMRLSCESAKNPIDVLSGDQNGYSAPSVPGSARIADSSSARTQSFVPSAERFGQLRPCDDLPLDDGGADGPHE
jgi:hypothetical protein